MGLRSREGSKPYEAGIAALQRKKHCGKHSSCSSSEGGKRKGPGSSTAVHGSQRRWGCRLAATHACMGGGWGGSGRLRDGRHGGLASRGQHRSRGWLQAWRRCSGRGGHRCSSVRRSLCQLCSSQVDSCSLNKKAGKVRVGGNSLVAHQVAAPVKTCGRSSKIAESVSLPAHQTGRP